MSDEDRRQAIAERLARIQVAQPLPADAMLAWGLREAYLSDVAWCLAEIGRLREALRIEPLHSPTCPYTPYADSDDEAPEGVACTCSRDELAARWKARAVLDRARARVAERTVSQQAEEIARLQAKLTTWQKCVACGQPLDKPGHCHAAAKEHETGMSLMYQETLERAEAAEARARELEDRLGHIEASIKELPRYEPADIERRPSTLEYVDADDLDALLQRGTP